MKSSFLLGYKYIFCLPSRRSGQITARALEIIYSFCSFACSSSSLVWQHVPDSSFSLVCILQHFVSSTDILHSLLCNHNCYRNIRHINLNVLSKNSDNHSYNFYIYSFFFSSSKPSCKSSDVLFSFSSIP